MHEIKLHLKAHKTIDVTHRLWQYILFGQHTPTWQMEMEFIWNIPNVLSHLIEWSLHMENKIYNAKKKILQFGLWYLYMAGVSILARE